MLKILGSFKVVPDLELLSEEDWTVDQSNLVDTSYVKTNLNCFDESALEMMLKLSDSSESFGITCELDALTVGGSLCDTYLKTLYALGFEKAVRIECEENLQFWPELTAGLVTEYMSQIGGQNVLLMGRQSGDGDNAKTPLLAAERLGWPCITQVIGIEPADEQHLRVISMEDQGTCTQTVRIPCVLSVGDAPCAYLRVPTLKDRIKNGKRSIEKYTAKDLDPDAILQRWKPKARLVELEPVVQSREGRLIEGETVQEKVRIFYESYLKGRLEKL